MDEQLVAFDDVRHRFTYMWVSEPAPLPVSNAEITVGVIPHENGSALVTWEGQFEVADSATAAEVERVNTEVVWPAGAEGLRQAVAAHARMTP